jgi:hypothetical protein
MRNNDRYNRLISGFKRNSWYFNYYKFGALTRKEHMFGWRPWELRREDIFDITGIECAPLIISSTPSFVFVGPKINHNTDFRWITDFTRFYYNCLAYGMTSARKTIIGFGNIRVLANTYNIKNLYDIIKCNVWFNNLLRNKKPCLVIKIGDFLTLKEIISLIDYCYSVGQDVVGATLSNHFTKYKVKELINDFNFSFVKDFYKKFTKVGVQKAKSLKINLNLYRLRNLEFFFHNILFRFKINRVLRNFYEKKQSNVFLFDSVLFFLEAAVNKSDFLEINSWFFGKNFYLTYNISEFPITKNSLFDEKLLTIFLIFYPYKSINLYNILYFVLVPIPSFLETGGLFWNFSGQLRKTYGLSKFKGSVLSGWSPGLDNTKKFGFFGKSLNL